MQALLLHYVPLLIYSVNMQLHISICLNRRQFFCIPDQLIIPLITKNMHTIVHMN